MAMRPNYGARCAKARQLRPNMLPTTHKVDASVCAFFETACPGTDGRRKGDAQSIDGGGFFFFFFLGAGGGGMSTPRARDGQARRLYARDADSLPPAC